MGPGREIGIGILSYDAIIAGEYLRFGFGIRIGIEIGIGILPVGFEVCDVI